MCNESYNIFSLFNYGHSILLDSSIFWPIVSLQEVFTCALGSFFTISSMGKFSLACARQIRLRFYLLLYFDNITFCKL